MAKGTIRVKNLKMSGVRSCEQHNRRLYAPDKMPVNVKVEKTAKNVNVITYDKASYKEAIDHRLKDIPVRKNSVVAIEFVMGATEDFYKGKLSAGKYLIHCMDFIKNRYGKENVIAVSMHVDEANPHIHVLIAPVVEKDVKWKNQRGEGIKKEKRLCARDITGGPKKLRALQEDFYQHIRKIEPQAGILFEPRVLVENQTKEYSKLTDYRMAEINRIAQQAQQVVDQAQHLELQRQILRHKEQLDAELKKKNEAEKEEAKKRKLNKGYGIGGGGRGGM